MTGPADLRRLPRWGQYALALAIAAVVVLAAWLVDGDRTAPAWITAYLIPALGWVYVAVFVYVAARWVRRRLR